MTTKNKRTAKKLKSMVGRQDWNGINPVERVVPNKKKGKLFRKAKHKNRRHDGGSYSHPQQGAARFGMLPVVGGNTAAERRAA